jgi:hypothetical protein
LFDHLRVGREIPQDAVSRPRSGIRRTAPYRFERLAWISVVSSRRTGQIVVNTPPSA